MKGFTTKRLGVRNWSADLSDPESRSALESALTGILSPKVLQHLPEPLNLPETEQAISDWVSARAEEGEVLLVTNATSGALIGLLILAVTDDDPGLATCHVGYLLAETAWGKGYATELVNGLVASLMGRGPIKIVGGVDKDNPGSARVLEKAGFEAVPMGTDASVTMYERRLGV